MKRIGILLLGAIMFCITPLQSCKKSDNGNIKQDNNSNIKSETDIAGAIIVYFITKAIVTISEGQYYEEKTYYPDGSVKSVKRGCNGLGACSMGTASMGGGSFNPNEPFFNTDPDMTDYELNISLGKTDDNRVILYLSEEDNSLENINRFFHSSVISIFKAGDLYSITNSEILEDLELEAPITFTGGEFPVYVHENGYKFVILSE